MTAAAAALYDTCDMLMESAEATPMCSEVLLWSVAGSMKEGWWWWWW